MAGLEKAEEFLTRRIAELGIRHFSATELLFAGAASKRGCIKNSAPPCSTWNNLLEIAKIADDLREHYGRPLRVVSAFRSARYNQSIGGAPHSQHLFGRALDLAPPADEDMEKFWGIVGKFREGRKDFGGLGRYWWGVHIDTGPRREWGE